jgi:CubicO group peptidase (beta-lactamase class C family)
MKKAFLPVAWALASTFGFGMNKSAPSYAQKIDTLISDYATQNLFSGAVLVAHKGKILFKKAYNLADRELNVANTTAMKFRIASLTKQFTALAILQLQEKKLLSISDPLSKFVPNFTQGDMITLHHLLSHSSGIPNITFFADFGTKCLQPTTLSEEVEYLRSNSTQLDFKPGTKYTYSNSNYIILSYIIEKVSGQSFESYLQDYILKPLGMHDSGLENLSQIIPNRTSGYVRNDTQIKNAPYFDFSWAVGSGGMYSTIEDMYRWNRALYANQQKIASPESFKQLFAPHTPIAAHIPNFWYGYGLALEECEFGLCISHEGNINGFSSYTTHYTKDDTSIIILSNFAFAPYKTIEATIRNIVANKSYESPVQKKSISVKKEDLEKFVGTYQMEEVLGLYRRAPSTFEIRSAGDHLVLSMRKNDYKIYPQTPLTFFLTTLEATLTFDVDAEGKVTGVVYKQNQEVTPGKKITAL